MVVGMGDRHPATLTPWSSQLPGVGPGDVAHLNSPLRGSADTDCLEGVEGYFKIESQRFKHTIFIFWFSAGCFRIRNFPGLLRGDASDMGKRNGIHGYFILILLFMFAQKADSIAAVGLVKYPPILGSPIHAGPRSGSQECNPCVFYNCMIGCILGEKCLFCHHTAITTGGMRPRKEYRIITKTRVDVLLKILERQNGQSLAWHYVYVLLSPKGLCV